MHNKVLGRRHYPTHHSYMVRLTSEEFQGSAAKPHWQYQILACKHGQAIPQLNDRSVKSSHLNKICTLEIQIIKNKCLKPSWSLKKKKSRVRTKLMKVLKLKNTNPRKLSFIISTSLYRSQNSNLLQQKASIKEQ